MTIVEVTLDTDSLVLAPIGAANWVVDLVATTHRTPTRPAIDGRIAGGQF